MAGSATNEELLARWRDEPAPLLPLLHAFHDRDGFLSEDALRHVADGLRIPLADLYGTVTFYHHFAREPGGRGESRVCVGPVCRQRGAETLAHALEARGERVARMPCPGRCDEPVPVLRGDLVVTGPDAEHLSNGPTPLPAPPASTAADPRSGGFEECVFRHIRDPGRATLEGYRATGGYAALELALAAGPGDVIDTLDASGLAGRGGAGFPTGRKWRAVAEADGGAKTVVCNADEGEPGCFKDRVLMDHDPFATLEGMTLAAYATGATLGFIYLRYEYPETIGILEDAIADATDAGLLGASILGRDGFDFRIHVRRGAGAYICGEETSLLNSLEGKHPFPRNRPPFPVTHGYLGRPTVVNNVETLCSVPPIVRKGAEWYRGLGLGDHSGTKVISLSGDVRRPGNYEVPLGLPLRTLLHDWAGGPSEGRAVRAVTMAGLSGGFIAGDDLDAVTLDEPSVRSRGSFLGAGGIMVFDDSRDMVDVSHSAMEFFAEESCGKCFPCRIGTQRLTERLNGGGPRDLAEWLDEVTDLEATMKSTSACGLGQAAPLVTESLRRYFPEQIERHLTERRPDE